MDNQVVIFDHPLISHKISILRDVNTGSKQFRELVEEIAMLMGYEALRDLPTEYVEVKTPITTTKSKMITGKKVAIVPILRAGLGMVEGILALIPTAKVGHIGLYRDEETLEPQEYYCKLPNDIANSIVIILDPMLATGGSAVAAVDFLKARGCKNIKFMSLIAAPEGIKKLTSSHPDIQLYCGCIDEKLNENGYIVPGLGDAGDRIFGTK
ncbi:MAG: uracil phosphoribosyltransferase [Ruminococcaceae bacterium]|nr:uracil phosphoribosyltransferase [Oscillospiraceae bacterium]